jgi:hypothetical protein
MCVYYTVSLLPLERFGLVVHGLAKLISPRWRTLEVPKTSAGFTRYYWK